MREIAVQDQVFAVLERHADTAIVMEDVAAESASLFEHEKVTRGVELQRAWGGETGSYYLSGVARGERDLDTVCRRRIARALLCCRDRDEVECGEEDCVESG